MLVSCLAYSSTLKTEASCSSETLVDFYRTTQHYIPEYRTPQMFMLLHKNEMEIISRIKCRSTF
jgi:hypothetical protein